MTKGLGDNQIKWLTYMVWILIFLLTIFTGYNNLISARNSQAIHEMPSSYVRLERYKSDGERYQRDQEKIYDMLKTLNLKVDRLINAKAYPP